MATGNEVHEGRCDGKVDEHCDLSCEEDAPHDAFEEEAPCDSCKDEAPHDKVCEVHDSPSILEEEKGHCKFCFCLTTMEHPLVQFFSLMNH